MSSEVKSAEEIFLKILDDIDTGEELFESRTREGIFTPSLTMWMMISQRADGGRAMAKVVEELSEGAGEQIWRRNTKSKRIKVKDISLNTSAFSQARSRLSMETTRKVTGAIAKYAAKQGEKVWHGRRVYLCDGTTLNLEATQANLSDYKPVRNQHKAVYAPEMQCLLCHELWSGTAMSPQFAPYRGPKSSSEQQLCFKVMDELPKKSLLIADRNFGIFAIAYEAERRKIQTLVRLSKHRAMAVGGAAFGKAGDIDIPTNWKFKTSRIPDLNIPGGANVEGRFIKHTLRRKGFRDLELFFFTTSTESAHELVELYAQRERIENDIRSLKYVVGMETLHGKTPEIIEKELLFGIASYNLVRAIVSIAAEELNIEPRKISFSRAARLTRIFGNQLSATKDKPEKNNVVARFIKGLNQSKIAHRAYFRIEPRKVVRGPQNFPLMKNSRSKERTEAKKILKKYGHRGYFTSVTRDY